MSSIYGWLSTTNTNGLARAINAQRAADPCLTANAQQVSCLRPATEIAGHGSTVAPCIYQSESLLAMIEGSPRWQDSALAGIAERHGPAQALAEGFQRHGRAVLGRIRGAFACYVSEPGRHYALLANDRFGIRPLAFYARKDLLVFGSQLDHIIAHPGVQTGLDPQAIFDYLYFHMIPSPGSIYAGVSKLQPGEFVEFNDGHIQRDFYWQISYADSPDPEKDLRAQLHDQLTRSVSACAPDSHTGAFLSGGLDSSTVTGVYQTLSSDPIDAFAIGFDAEGYDEMAYARATARHFKVNLHEYYVTPADVLQAIPLIARTYDEPFGNASAIPAYYCARFAREHGMRQLLAGDGGDEIFAGNTRYAKQKLFDLYRHVPLALKSGLIEPVAQITPLLGKVRSYIEQAGITMPARMETYNFLHRTPLADIFTADFLAQVDASAPLASLQRTYDRAGTDDLVKQMLFLDAKITLADNDLRKVNRMCDLAGVGVHYPLLQDNLVEFAASIPSGLLMQRFQLRSFYRKSMAGFLAPETLSKSKHGFGLPFGLWMSADPGLREFADVNLRGMANRGIIHPDYIKTIIKAQQQGHAAYYGVMIWILMMLEQWLVSHNQ
jgi:asparagine synthase (glutamine-hydrolysing)